MQSTDKSKKKITVINFGIKMASPAQKKMESKTCVKGSVRVTGATHLMASSLTIIIIHKMHIW